MLWRAGEYGGCQGSKIQSLQELLGTRLAANHVSEGALQILATKAHIKKVDWLRQQSMIGTQAMESFMKQRLNIVHQPKMELLPAILHELTQNITRQTNCKNIHLLGFIDMNAPFAKLKERVDAWALGCQTLNERNPGKSMVIMILPDRAKASSARGLADEGG